MGAEQLKFEKTRIANSYQYEFIWKDIEEIEQRLTFRLPMKNVNGDYRHFKALRPSLLRMHSLRQLQEAVGTLDPRQGQVKLLPSPNRLEFEIRGRDPKWVKETSVELERLYQTSLKEYLYREYYVEFSGFHRQASSQVLSYKPDHRRFIEESGASLQPIIDTINDLMPRASARNVAKFLLSWLQTMPYNEMQSRTQSNGAGFLPPLQVVDRNQGDCDSKVSLMATILKHMYPRLRITIVYIPNHALIGFNVSHLQEDYTLDIDGLDYTLAEPVGPGMIKFAEISQRSKQYIESGNYRVELLFNP